MTSIRRRRRSAVCVVSLVFASITVIGGNERLGRTARADESAGGIRDCNRNGIADDVEVADGSAADCNTNDIPDECEICSTAMTASNNPRDYCSPHPGGSCDCQACAAAVCGVDPFCCDAEWDDICAQSAAVSPECPCGVGPFEPQTDCDDDGDLDECQNLSPWRGSALVFDGRGAYVTAGTDEALRMDAGFTLEAWIQPSGPGSDSTQGGIIANREGEYELARFADGTIRFALANGVPGWAWASSRVVAPRLAWTHIALVYDSSRRNVRVLADGEEAFALTGNVGGAIHDVEPTFNEFRIGGRQRVEQFFDGQIDEVRIWNLPRPSADIAADRNRWLRGDEPGLVGYWRLNEGRGQTAFDRADGHHGAVVGAPWKSSQRCILLGDLDSDGDVSAADVGELTRCILGPGQSSLVPPCRPDASDAADLQRDGDVDLADLRILLNRVVAPTD